MLCPIHVFRHGCFLCLARSSDDGLSFTKPMDLGVVSFNGSTQNNLVLQLSEPKANANSTEGRPAGLRTAATVFVDDNPAVPPSERYKFTADGVADGQPMTPVLTLYGSADGVRWKPLSAGSKQMRLWSDVGDTQPVTFWDPRESRYQTYGRYEPGPRKCSHTAAARVVGYSAAAVNDSLFGSWSNVTAALGFPTEGPCTDTYNSAAIQVHNAYIMLPSQYLHVGEPTFPQPDHSAMNAHGSSNDGVLDVRLAISGNTTRFTWVSDEAFIERGVGSIDHYAQKADWHYAGEWDAGMLFAVRGYHNTPTRTAIFYWGTQVTHGDYPFIYAYPNATNGIGRATMRRDGWFSFDADDGSDAQTLLTAPITLPSKPSTLALNMLTTVRGYVKVELQDATTGAAVPGFALADSVPSMGNYLARAQQWSNATALPAGKCVRIRLEAVQAKLFTFSFGPV